MSIPAPLKIVLLAVLLWVVTPGLKAEVRKAEIVVDGGVTVTGFYPISIFGNNVPAWTNPVPVKDKIQGAGNYLLRIPGGSWGDVYHWNSKGIYNKKGEWVPSDTDYAPSVLEKGCESKYFSTKFNDGKIDTAWWSNRETDDPDGQWIYLELNGKNDVDGARITWGDKADSKFPYAKKFSLQYWDPAEERQWMVHGADRNAWVDLVTDAKGKGGNQNLKFKKTNTQYLRLLMKESSEGRGGTYAVAEFQALCGGKPISLAGWNPAVASSTAVVSSGHDERKIFGFEEYMDFLNSFTPKAVPLVIVNFGTGTPQEAAAWVHYANKVKGYGIKLWEIGNEVGGQWEAGGPVNSRDYARRYLHYYEAMKAEDPTITIIGQTGFSDPSGAYDGKLCLQSFVDRLAKDKKEGALDALSIHQYCNWGQPVSELLDSPATQLAEMAASVKKQLSAYPALAQVPVILSEFNTSDQIKPHDVSVRLENAIWLSQYLPEFIRAFGTRGSATLWDVMNGGKAIHEETGGDHGYLQEEDGPYRYQERADYWAIKMMTQYWSGPGDARLHQMMQAEATEKKLAVYANQKPDGSLALWVVNKDPENAYDTTLNLKGFKSVKRIKGWKFDRDNYQWRTEQKPYHADPDKAPTSVDVSVLTGKIRYTFTPYSLTVIQFNK